MDELTLLANALMALDDKLAACMKCGMCQSVCPVFGETLMEADVTRGKLTLLENLAHRLIEDPEAVDEKLNRCLLCGSCQANCPSGVSILEIFMEARAIVAAYKGLSPVKKAIFRTLLPNPKLFALLVKLSGPFQGLAMREDHNAQGTATCSPLLRPILGDRHMPLLSDKPLRSKVGKVDRPAGKSGLRVAFFPGCMGDKIYTGVSEACLKVFEHHGVGVFLSDNFACCGIPALVSGDREGVEKMIEHNLGILSRTHFDYIVTPCSSCTMTIKEYWPEMSRNLPASVQETAKKFGAKAIDINAFLVDVLGVHPEGPAKGGLKVTYHESCHLKKSLGVSKQPRELINMNKNCELVEMVEPDRCCGCGGSFTLTHYDISQQIGQKKRDSIVATGADVVATGCSCPTCWHGTATAHGSGTPSSCTPTHCNHCLPLPAEGALRERTGAPSFCGR